MKATKIVSELIKKIPNDHPIDVVCSSYTVDPLKLSDSKHSISKRSVDENERALKKSKLTDASATSRVATIVRLIYQCFLQMRYCFKLLNYLSLSLWLWQDCFSDTAYCHKINCSFFGDFSKDESIALKFTARLWNSTLVEDFADFEKVLIKSHAKLILNDDIHDDKPFDNEHSVTTVAYSQVVVKLDKAAPLWLYGLSVLIGLIILIICIIGFWMVSIILILIYVFLLTFCRVNFFLQTCVL